LKNDGYGNHFQKNAAGGEASDQGQLPAQGGLPFVIDFSEAISPAH